MQDGPNGRLVVSARVARGGNVQEYLGSEMGVKDREIVRVYRPADEVFDRESMGTFPHKFMTLDHPPMPASFEQHAVGWIGDEVARDGEFIRVPMTIAHRKAVDAIKAGKRELSVGYATELVWESGTTPDGKAYDAKMTKIVVDHVAIVDAARGGSQLRIGDWRAPDLLDQRDNLRELPMSDVKTQTVLVDGLSVLTTDAGAQAIAKLQKDIADGKAAHAALVGEHEKAIAAKDAALAKAEAERDGYKAKVLTDSQLDARVKERGDLIATAKSIADGDYSGKTSAEIKRAVVAAKCGDSAVKDKSDTYVEARFDMLAEDVATTDPVRRTFQQHDTRNDNRGDDIYAAHNKRVADRFAKA